MTLAVQIPRAVFIGNGTRGPYSLLDEDGNPIRLTAENLLRVVRYSSVTDEIGTALTYPTDYSVGGTTDARTITLSMLQAVLASTQRLVVERVNPLSQTLNLTLGGDFNGVSVMSRFDKIEEQIQEVRRDADRSVKVDWLEDEERALPLPPTSGIALLGRNDTGAIVHADSVDFGSGTVVDADWLDIVTAAPGTGWDSVLALPAAGILDNLSGVRFVATYAALTALTTATGLSDGAVYCTRARSTADDGGYGLWRYNSASATTANGGTILAIDGGGAGRFFRLYDKRINVRWFGAVGDGTTDDTTAIGNARTALVAQGGGFLDFPHTGSPYKCNLVITGSNIHLNFEAPNFYTGLTATTGLKAAILTDPVLQFGDGTTTTRGCSVWNLAMNGEGTADKGLYILGADTITFYNFSARNFEQYQARITSSATKGSYFIEFHNPRLYTGTTAGSLGLDLIYGSFFTNAIKVFGGALSAQAGGSHPLQLSGSGLNAELNGTHIEGINNQGINFATTGTAVRCANVTVDSDSSADVLVIIPSNTVVADYLYGTVTVDGVASMTGGNTAALSGRYLLKYDALMSAPSIQGKLTFQDSSANAWDRHAVAVTTHYLERTGNNIQATVPGSWLMNVGSSGSLAAVGSDSRLRLVGTDSQETRIRHARVQVSPSGATATATNLIPAGGVLVLGVTVRVTTALGGATSFEVGDGTDVDRWGTAVAVALDTTTSIANFTITSPVYYPTATSVVLTANGSNFSSGVVKVSVHYIDLVAALT